MLGYTHAATSIGGFVSDSEDVAQLLIRTCEMLRAHQETVFKSTLATLAVVQALKEKDPAFADLYDHHFWELKQGKMGEEHVAAVRTIEEMKRKLLKE